MLIWGAVARSVSIYLRNVDPNDRRAKIASLTVPAADILSQIAQAGKRVEQKISAHLSDEDWQAFQQTALRIRKNLTELRGAVQPLENEASK